MCSAKKKTGCTVIIWLLLIISIGCIGYFGYFTLTDITARKKANDAYQTLTVNYAPPVQKIQETNLPGELPVFYPDRNIDYTSLKQQNKDYIGWLYFPFIGKDENYSFTIDYPIVYEQQTNQYLKTGFDQTYSINGSVFMDKLSNPSFFGYHDILYGHHMRDGSMFGKLELIHDMNDLDYLKSQPQFLYIYTKTACHKYIMIGYEQLKTSNSFGYNAAYDNKAYDLIKKHVMSLDTYIESDDFTWTGRPEILSLSTCDGDRAGTSERFLLHFVKVMAYEYN